jgi:hypothetical protein
MAGPAADDRRDALAELLALVSSVEDADLAIQRGLVFTADFAMAASSPRTGSARTTSR